MLVRSILNSTSLLRFLTAITSKLWFGGSGFYVRIRSFVVLYNNTPDQVYSDVGCLWSALETVLLANGTLALPINLTK
jgi:hypothetical protein